MEDGPSARARAGRRRRAHARGRARRHRSTRRPSPTLEVPEGEPRNISAQHAAAAIRYGDRYLLKMFRRLEEGDEPGAGARPLPERARAGPDARRRRRDRVRPAARRAEHAGGAAGLRPQRGHGLGARPRGAASLLRARADAPPRGCRRPPRRRARWPSWPPAEPPAAAREVIGAYLDLAALLGRRTAEMHLALASNIDDASFAPVPYSTLDRRSKLPVGAQPGRARRCACCASAWPGCPRGRRRRRAPPGRAGRSRC